MNRRPDDTLAEAEQAWWVGGLLVLAIVGLVVLVGRGGDPDEGAFEGSPIAAPVATEQAPPAEPDAEPEDEGEEAAFANQDGRNVVCLDPGHGGTDRGHVETDPDGRVMEEKSLTLTVAEIVADRVAGDGIETVMTRTTDTVVNASGEDVNGDGITAQEGQTSQELDDLLARVNICNAANADLLVSIHFNGADNPDLEGYEVFYNPDRPFSDRSERFATLLYEAFGNQYETAGYAAEPHGIGVEDHVVTGPAREGRTSVAQMPGALGEALYLSNADDARFVLSQGALFAVALAYEEAIVRYFEEFPG